MKRILITGANGQVGQEFQWLSREFPDFDFVFKTKSDLDICDAKAVKRFFDDEKIDYCINCAAYTAVDKAEEEQEIAYNVNVLAPANLGGICAAKNIPVIHFSTDYVYHSTQNIAYVETDAVNPQSVYASTKLKGEQKLMEVHANAMIIRTSWVYSVFGHNFVKTMLRLGKERDQLTIVADQIGSPTNARDLARAVLQILAGIENGKLPEKKLSGIYNFSNEGVCSWYDFALAIFEISGISCDVKPIETTDYPTPAKRPPFSLLNKNKFKSTFETDIPHWRESLNKMLAEL